MNRILSLQIWSDLQTTFNAVWCCLLWQKQFSVVAGVQRSTVESAISNSFFKKLFWDFPWIHLLFMRFFILEMIILLKSSALPHSYFHILQSLCSMLLIIRRISNMYKIFWKNIFCQDWRHTWCSLNLVVHFVGSL